MTWRCGLFLSLFCLAFFPRLVDAAAERTLVLANENLRESVELAEYYMEKRAIPAENLYLVSAPRSETIRWDQFIDSIYNPLRTKLIEDNWLQGTLGERKDPEGRLLHSTSGHRIEYMVICHGIPLRIRHDEDRLPEEVAQQIPEPLWTNRGAVDSQLALISHSVYGINAYQQNPLFEKRFPSAAERASVVRVARLDGPSAAEARGLIDSALEAERNGLRGRAYIDLGGPHPAGDEWLEAVAGRIERLGFDLSIHDGDTDLGISSRFDAPALYFGWYAPHVTEPFTLDGFRFPPGAIALHIHSFSATTVRSHDRRWVGPFVASGAAATVGNVYEPYLELTHRPNLLLDSLARGQTLGEAAYYSLPVLSWQGIVVGDPLYRPFAVSLERQLASENASGNALRQYSVIRRMNLLEREGEREAALRLGEAAYKEDPRIPLAFSLARLHAATGDRAAIRDRLAFIPAIDSVPLTQSGTLLEILVFLVENDLAPLSVEGFRRLLSTPDLPPKLRKDILTQATNTVRTTSDRQLSREWDSELNRLEN